MYKDNQGLVALVKNPIHHSISKHIKASSHVVPDCLTKKKLTLVKMSMVDNISDAIKNSLSSDRF